MTDTETAIESNALDATVLQLATEGLATEARLCEILSEAYRENKRLRAQITQLRKADSMIAALLALIEATRMAFPRSSYGQKYVRVSDCSRVGLLSGPLIGDYLTKNDQAQPAVEWAKRRPQS